MAAIEKKIKFSPSPFKEIADFCRFFWRTSKREKEIVFYSEHEGYYPYFEGIIEKLIGEYKQTLCYVTSDINDPILQRADSEIKTFYLNKLLAFFMAFVNCKVFVITMTDLNQFHLKRSIYPAQYVYVFHSLASTHMKFRYGSYDYYDYILCVGPYHMKEIRRHEELNNLKPKKLMETGYYRLERIYAAYQKYASRQGIDPVGKKTILLAPSWGEGNLLETYGQRLVGILTQAGYKVIVRPHPETLKHFPALITSLVAKFGANSDFTLETSVATDDSLLRADVLICDYSGVALEYAFGTERPVLSIDVPVPAKNPKYRELGIEPLEVSLRSKIGVIVSPDKLDTIPQVISGLIADTGAYKKRIAELRKENIYAFGHSADIGAKIIIDLVKGIN